MSIEKIKDKVKANYEKSPRTVASVALVGGVSLFAALGVLTGIIEPDTAVNLVTRVVSLFALGA